MEIVEIIGGVLLILGFLGLLGWILWIMHGKIDDKDNINNNCEMASCKGRMQPLYKGAKEDSKNPYFKSDYADLTSVWKACRNALTENGIAVCQTMDTDQEKIVLITTILHSSGQWMKSKLPVIMTKNDPQTLGSSLTYTRRYALAAIAGVCPMGEDDDAESAMEESRKDNIKETPKQSVSKEINKKDQVKRLIKELNDPVHISNLESYFKIANLENLEDKQLIKVIENLNQKIEERSNGKSRVA